ncbi:hypothetical protein VTN31DRAFT_1524 [Thermomyces dupontii]|uniref:uncharacterized protein n=1 Tax=Talaromyces thermophilus TaxID=28565 RepID=UPI0037440703
MAKFPHVGIVGAGISGLRCADVLLQNGAKVTILEARDRIGGRIAQIDVGGHLVDLGANWIHGTESNPIYELSVATNTTTYDPDGHQLMFDPTGKPLDQAMATRISEWMWTMVDEGFEYSTNHKDEIPANMSLFDFFRERLETTNFTPSEKSACLNYCKLWGAYIGEPVERQSLKFFHLEECIEGTNLFVASTYKDILDHVSKPALQRADIKFNEPVVKIESGDRESGDRKPITVTTSNNRIYQFDEVVVTCPLGWLKRNKSVFQPQLPPQLSSAIDHLAYGRLEKIYVNFPRAFWHVDQRANGKIALSEGAPTFTQFMQPSYVENPAGDASWHVDCVSMAVLPAPCAHPTLLFYIYGPCAEHVVSRIKDLDEGSKEYHDFLVQFLHPFYSKLPGYDATSAHCTPVAVRASKWQADPYAGNGSYTNFQIGLESGDKDIEILRLGIGRSRGVWFAGEHTAPFVGLGTTTGAYWSGERAAGQICDVYNLGRVGLGERRDDSLPTGNGILLRNGHLEPISAVK